MPYVRFFFFFGGGREVYYEKFAEWLFCRNQKQNCLSCLSIWNIHQQLPSTKICTHTDSIRIIHHQTPDGTALMNFASPSCEEKTHRFVVSRPVTQRADRGKHEGLSGRGVAQCQTITTSFLHRTTGAPGISDCSLTCYYSSHPQHTFRLIPLYHVAMLFWRTTLRALLSGCLQQLFPHAVAGPYTLVQLNSHYLAWLDENP